LKQKKGWRQEMKKNKPYNKKIDVRVNEELKRRIQEYIKNNDDFSEKTRKFWEKLTKDTNIFI
jgi:hypothetical protein